MDREYLEELILNKYEVTSKVEAKRLFSEEIGVSLSYVYRILKNKLPDEEILMSLSKILDIDYNRLFKNYRRRG